MFFWPGSFQQKKYWKTQNQQNSKWSFLEKMKPYSRVISLQWLLLHASVGDFLIHVWPLFNFFQSICTDIYIEKNWISFCNFRLEQQELQKALHLMLPPILLKLLVQRLTRLTNVHYTGHRLGLELCPLLVTPQTLWPRSTFHPNTCPISGSWEESPCCVS